MKKIFVFVLLCMCSITVFAQMSISELTDQESACVIYNDSFGNRLYLANMGNYHLASYRDSANTKVTTVSLEIAKDYNTKIELLEIKAGDEQSYKSDLLPWLQRLYSYTDMGMRDMLPNAFKSTQKDLFGAVLREADVDFFIPILNVICERDSNGDIISSCERFGLVYDDTVNYFLESPALPSPVIRPMKKIFSLFRNTTNLGNISVELGSKWQENNFRYMLPNTTKCDSLLWAEQIDLDDFNRKDIYGYLVAELFNTEAIIFPDSIKIENIGDVVCLSFDCMDYYYGEKNTCMIIFNPEQGKKLDVLRINGYSEFVIKNEIMFRDIIKSIEFNN